MIARKKDSLAAEKIGKLAKVEGTINLLSVNEAWAGRRFKTPKYKAYEEELLLTLPKVAMIKGNVAMFYEFRVKNMGRDTSNMIKPLEDILVKKGYIEDDRKVIEIKAVKVKSAEEGFKVYIMPL